MYNLISKYVYSKKESLTFFNNDVTDFSRSPEILDWEETKDDSSLRLLKRTHYAKGHVREVNCVHANEAYMISGSRGRRYY